MIAVDTAASPQTPVVHEQHDHAATPGQVAIPSTHDRMLAGFSHHVLHRPPRAYQRLVGAAILASVLNGYGATFTVMMARQMGKNELSAHLEAGLLARFARAGDTLVKAAPTFRPQVTTSLQRLESLLKAAHQYAPLTRRYPDGQEVVLKPRKHHGYQLVLPTGDGDARISFLSADPAASVVGATASLLLEIDEAQDVDPDKFARDFRPMASAHNATTVLYGTAWTQDTLLEQQKQVNLALEAQDGIRRHFEFDWQVGAAANPSYGQFVRAELDRLSPDHPLVRTQYLLLPRATAGAFFTPEQRALLRGDHPRQSTPTPSSSPPSSSLSPLVEGGAPSSPSPRVGEGPGVRATTTYVAGVDVAGPAEDPQDPDHLLRARQPRKDSTVVLVAEVTPAPAGAAGAPDHPLTRIVEAYWWTGRPLHEQCDRLVALLKHEWRCARVVVDASGLGLDLATRLQKALGERTVERFTFTAASKSDLAYALLAHVASGRLQMWDERVPGARAAAAPSAARRPRLRTKILGPAAQGYAALSPEANEFWREVERARPTHSDAGAGARLGFYVPDQYGHDDFLVALALLSRAACAAVRAYPYIPPMTVMLRPPPDPWDLPNRPWASDRYTSGLSSGRS